MNDQNPWRATEDYMYLHGNIPGEPKPAFEEPIMLEKVWGRKWGVNNDVGELRSVLVSRPGTEWEPMMSGGEYDERAQAWIGADKMWYWSDRNRPNLEKAQAQHDRLVATLHAVGIEVLHLENPKPNMTKSVFTRDPAIMVKGGAIICRLGVSYRRGEELPFTRTLSNLGIPILRTINGTGLMEGGGFAWLKSETAVVGIGHRTNSQGVRQLAEILASQDVELLTVDTLGYGLHIDGYFLMVASDMALAFSFKLPWQFLERLKGMGIRVVDADPRDGAFGVNCLALKPGRVIMASHAVRTTDRLDKFGVDVILLDYDELHKHGGGIHYSTLPLIRDEL